MGNIIANQILGVLDIIGALGLVWATQKITTEAGFSTPLARWALTRRAVNLLWTLALFILGIGRFEGLYQMQDVIGIAAQCVLLGGIIFYPMMRALGFISQDTVIANGARDQRVLDRRQRSH